MRLLSRAYNYIKENTKYIFNKKVGKITAGVCVLGFFSLLFDSTTNFLGGLAVGMGVIATSFLLVEILFGLARQDFPDKKRKNVLLVTSSLLFLIGLRAYGILDQSSILLYPATILMVTGILGVYLRMTLGMVEYMNKSLEKQFNKLSSKLTYNEKSNTEVKEQIKEEQEIEHELELTRYFNK